MILPAEGATAPASSLINERKYTSSAVKGLIESNFYAFSLFPSNKNNLE